MNSKLCCCLKLGFNLSLRISSASAVEAPTRNVSHHNFIIVVHTFELVQSAPGMDHHDLCLGCGCDRILMTHCRQLAAGVWQVPAPARMSPTSCPALLSHRLPGHSQHRTCDCCDYTVTVTTRTCDPCNCRDHRP